MTRLLLVMLMLLLSGMTSAKIYKWVDAQGEVHYQDHPRGTPEKFYNGQNPNSAKQTQRNHIVTQEAKPQKQPKTRQQSPAQKAADKKLTEQRKQVERCNRFRKQVQKLEARLKQDSKFASKHPDSYLRQQKLLIRRQQYLDQHCN